jgi:hypothetical protein
MRRALPCCRRSGPPRRPRAASPRGLARWACRAHRLGRPQRGAGTVAHGACGAAPPAAVAVAPALGTSSVGPAWAGQRSALSRGAVAPRGGRDRPSGLAPRSRGHGRAGGVPASGAGPTAQRQSHAARDRAVLESAPATRPPASTLPDQSPPQADLAAQSR